MDSNKKEILSKFLKEGHQLDGEALDFFVKNPEEIDVFLRAVKDETGPPTTIKKNHILSVLGQSSDGKRRGAVELKIIKQLSSGSREERVDIGGYTSLYKKRYEKISSMLLEKMPDLKVTSINKIQKQAEFSLIVMVREKDLIGHTLVVEDPTGNIIVGIADATKEYDSIIEDDVLGLVCMRTKDGVNVKQMIWPDIPLKREINKTERDIGCLFISGLDEDALNSIEEVIKKTEYEKLYIFAVDEISIDGEEVNSKTGGELVALKASSLISISGVKILLINSRDLNDYKEKWPEIDTAKLIINLLKRRHLVGKHGVLIFDVVPDIVAIGGAGQFATSNYKGTTIVSVGASSGTKAPTAWLLELRSREINKINLS